MGGAVKGEEDDGREVRGGGAAAGDGGRDSSVEGAESLAPTSALTPLERGGGPREEAVTAAGCGCFSSSRASST